MRGAARNGFQLIALSTALAVQCSRSRLAFALAGFALLSAGATAQDKEADAALERLKQSLQSEPNLSEDTKAAMADFFDALSERHAELDAVDMEALQRLAASAPVAPGRWEKLKERLTVHGDLRLREEVSFKLDDQENRERMRYRLRLGADYRLDDEFTVGARIRTGDRMDPNSPHSTLGDGFRTDEVSLDRAFIAYRPEGEPGLRVIGGKFQHPFYANPIYGELVWDADVAPEGIAATYTLPGDESGERLDFALGLYTAVEQGGGPEARVLVAQVAGHERLGEQTTGSLALGYYQYSRITPDGGQLLVGENPSQTAGGNQLIDTDGDTVMDDYASGFKIWNPIASVTHTGWCEPVTFSAEYIRNADATGSRDSGYALGVAVGQQREPGDWQYYYQWQKVEQEAVFAAFAQDDFLLAANQVGHVFGTRYRITDQVGAHLWALISARDSAGTTATTDSRSDQWRVRFDIDVRF